MRMDRDQAYMEMALTEARKAETVDEVPIGAVVVSEKGDIIGRGYNHPITAHDPTAHAEIVALREASRSVGNYRLAGSTLFCTLEPCLMCAGAIIHSRIARLVFGAPDPKAGAAGSLYNILTDPRLNHSVDIIRGLCFEECASLLQNFFTSRRGK